MRAFKNKNVLANDMTAAKRNFIPCVFSDSLLETFSVAVKSALRGDVILHSSACSSFDQLRNYQHRGEVSRYVFTGLAATIGRGRGGRHPNIQTSGKPAAAEIIGKAKKLRFAPGFFEEKPRRESSKTINKKHHLT